MGLIPTVMEVSLAGMKVDVKKLEEKAEELKMEIDKLKSSVMEMLGQEIKINKGKFIVEKIKNNRIESVKFIKK